VEIFIAVRVGMEIGSMHGETGKGEFGIVERVGIG
jgi:hypothetical protein